MTFSWHSKNEMLTCTLPLISNLCVFIQKEDGLSFYSTRLFCDYTVASVIVEYISE